MQRGKKRPISDIQSFVFRGYNSISRECFGEGCLRVTALTGELRQAALFHMDEIAVKQVKNVGAGGWMSARVQKVTAFVRALHRRPVMWCQLRGLRWHNSNRSKQRWHVSSTSKHWMFTAARCFSAVRFLLRDIQKTHKVPDFSSQKEKHAFSCFIVNLWHSWIINMRKKMLFCKLKIVQQFPENGNFTQFSIHFFFFCQVLKLKHKHKIKADKNAVTKYSAPKTLSWAQLFSPCAHSGEKKKTFGRPTALVNVKVNKRHY